MTYVEDKIPSIELGKIILAMILLFISCLCVVGIIPSAILLISYLLSIRDPDLSIFLKAIQFMLSTMLVITSIFIFGGIVMLPGLNQQEIQGIFLVLPISVGLLYFLVKTLLLNPFTTYEYEIKKNGLFFTPKNKIITNTDTKNEITHNSSLEIELTRIKSLKEKGLISSEEYIQLRQKILDRI